jgi:hypothetical protein
VSLARIVVGAVSLATTSVVRAVEAAASDRSSTGERRANAAEDAVRSLAKAVTWVPGVSVVTVSTTRLARIARSERARSEEAASRFVAALLPEVTDALLARLDLTRIVVDNVDLDEVVKGVDIEAVVNRVDLVGIANYLIDELEVPEIIRESTGALAVESIEQIRVQGIRADRFVSHLLDRIVRRGQERELDGPQITAHASTLPEPT